MGAGQHRPRLRGLPGGGDDRGGTWTNDLGLKEVPAADSPSQTHSTDAKTEDTEVRGLPMATGLAEGRRDTLRPTGFSNHK